jgi:hypothetical protein
MRPRAVQISDTLVGFLLVSKAVELFSAGESAAWCRMGDLHGVGFLLMFPARNPALFGD